ncbi:MAG: hypothetical protein JW880_00690 [Candidatus Thermoplasmatota archaeon]|nr:hypothetical protein [Candidatus Thermoplasmatota archaeon]
MTSRDIVVYAGRGSSHSWTWLADLFESKGIFRVRFLDSSEFVLHLGDQASMVIISGGDGFAIADELRGKGFERLREFISFGGRYVGICAGAYLPLPSTIDPFLEFNLSSTRIENIGFHGQDPPNVPSRIAVRYGSCSIVHPIRGELVLDADGCTLLAPLYGGPIFKEPAEDHVLLRYRGLTENTEVQMSRRLVDYVLPGRPAAIRSRFGKGELLLLGPHLEHPKYPEANTQFLKLLGLRPSALPRSEGVRDTQSLESAIADLKVAIVGLENRSFIVGKKLWDAGRYLELVRAIEARTWTLSDDLAEEIATALWRVREAVIAMNVGIESEADETTQLLVETARACVDDHFQSLVRGR